MRVVLSSNVQHYYYAAIALQDAGLLARYICAICVRPSQRWLYKALPDYWEKKLKGREVDLIDPQRVKTIWLPELLQKGLPRLGLMSADRANWLNNHLYDWSAKRYVESCDVFHWISSVGLYSARRAKSTGATLVCEDRSVHPDFERSILREEYEGLGLAFDPPGLAYEGKVKAEYALADYLIVCSSLAKQTFVEAGHDPSKIFIQPHGTKINHDRPIRPNDERGFRIIYVGQIIPRKGIHYLVQAFEELALPHSELLLVGPVGVEMRPCVERWTRNASIKVIGSVAHVELGKYYSRSSLFVIPAIVDAFPLVVSEAMASGLPVIISENTGSKEMVREGIDGFIVPIRDVESLKRQITLLYEDEERRKEMGDSARSRVVEFGWSRYGERVISTYAEIARQEGIEHELVGD
jgi:glycosyltransferase involved in cell wall biosynthesis